MMPTEAFEHDRTPDSPDSQRALLKRLEDLLAGATRERATLPKTGGTDVKRSFKERLFTDLLEIQQMFEGVGRDDLFQLALSASPFTEMASLFAGEEVTANFTVPDEVLQRLKRPSKSMKPAEPHSDATSSNPPAKSESFSDRPTPLMPGDLYASAVDGVDATPAINITGVSDMDPADLESADFDTTDADEHEPFSLIPPETKAEFARINSQAPQALQEPHQHRVRNWISWVLTLGGK